MSHSLERSQAALLAYDLATFESQIVFQEALCRDLRASLGQAAPCTGRSAAAQLLQRVRVYAAVLRRVKRTAGIFARILASSGVTYTNPGAIP